jgi:hypothetical protein
MPSVSYEEIERNFADSLEDERRHLFNISGVRVMFWSTLGDLWRIVTDLPLEVAGGVARSLNDGVPSHRRRYQAHEAWHDINPKYKTPRMRSELIGELPTPNSVDRVWAAISIASSSGGGRPSPSAAAWSRRVSRGVRIPEPPEGRDLDGVLSRVEVDEGATSKPRPDQAPLGDIEPSNGTGKDDLIAELRRRGKTYREISLSVAERLGEGEKPSRGYIYKVLKNRGLIDSGD